MRARKKELRLQCEGRADRDAIPIEFDEAEWSLLEQFVGFVIRAESCQMFMNGRDLNLSMKWDRSTGLETSVTLPPDHEIHEFLHVLRPLILQNERASFLNIAGLLGRKLNHELVRTMLKGARERFLSDRIQDQFTLTSNGQVLNSEATLKLWLNSYEYHTDAEQKERLDALHTTIPLDSTRALFMHLLIDKLRAAQIVAAFVQVLLGDRETLELRPSDI